jgi:hypothetical protein
MPGDGCCDSDFVAPSLIIPKSEPLFGTIMVKQKRESGDAFDALAYGEADGGAHRASVRFFHLSEQSTELAEPSARIPPAAAR